MIKTLKDLEKLIKLCQKHNIPHIKIGDIELSIPERKTKSTQSPYIEELPGITADMQIPLPTVLSAENKREIQESIITDGLSEEELLFYSADLGSTEQQ